MIQQRIFFHIVKHEQLSNFKSKFTHYHWAKPPPFCTVSRGKKKARHVLCRVGESVTHVRVKNDGDCFNLIGPGGETFASLSDLVRYYYDNKDRQELRDTAGTAIYLKYPLPSVDHSSERYI